jgi:hypothetical protein
MAGNDDELEDVKNKSIPPTEPPPARPDARAAARPDTRAAARPDARAAARPDAPPDAQADAPADEASLADRRLAEAQHAWQKGRLGELGRKAPALAKREDKDDVVYQRMYPFTKGMTLTNDGVAYGEIFFQRVVIAARDGKPTASVLVRALRTRTGIKRLGPGQ